MLALGCESFDVRRNDARSLSVGGAADTPAP
jgi:hypothetical protein